MANRKPPMVVVYKDGDFKKRVATIWQNEGSFGPFLSFQPCTEDTEYTMPFADALKKVTAKKGFLNVHVNDGWELAEVDVPELE